MPVTRSATRSATAASSGDEPSPRKAPVKRKASAAAPAPKNTAKKARGSTQSQSTSQSQSQAQTQDADGAASVPRVYTGPPPTPPVLVPAVLTFSFEDAKEHLIAADGRFEDVFRRLPCKPFEHLERLDPFRTLVNSIMGQQISWRAARSIIHRFIRLFDPSLPEKPTDKSQSDFFPSAHQVASLDVATLRTAGLSGRKAEYVLDLATRFADGRLSTEKLLEASDEELAEMLIAVRGIGRWTVDMFALFSLRRPDILPVGDLGVQRGVLRWFYALHTPGYPLTLSPEKLPKEPDEQEGGAGEPPPPPPPETADANRRALSPDASSVMPAPPLPQTPLADGKLQDAASTGEGERMPAGPLPPPFTPSINKTLHGAGANGAALPEGLTPGILRSRLEGKKIKGAFLTPKEMEELTEEWRPYRSLGVYYMWALAEPPK